MRLDMKTAIAMAAAAALLLGGCDDSSKNTVKVRPAAPVPLQTQTLPENLPFPQYTDFNAFNLIDRRSRVEILVERMQANYTAGQRSYAAGDTDEARKLFNRAVDMVQESGIPADSDIQLSELFDQIVDTMRSYDLDNTEADETDNTTQGMSEPAPIDEIADLTTLPSGDPRLAQKAISEMMKVPHDMPLCVNDSVLQYLSFFQTEHGRLIVETGLRRAGRYTEMIRRVLKEEGMPQDLIYLAQAESAFQPQAVSRAGARGIWQFMPFRGQEYDLERTWWIDERSDPEKATRAAAHHLRDLYGMFGDWYLVMAAYNSGPGNVSKAIERTGYADFWELQKRNVLPNQTKNYVPIILALALVAKDPLLYGVKVEPDKPPVMDFVQPGHPIDLRLVADATGADLDDLRLLNPQMLRLVTPDESDFTLRLPVGTAAKFSGALASIPPDKWKSWRIHEVTQGETLAAIAKTYRVTPASVMDVNRLESASAIRPGDRLTIPAAAVTELKLVHYRVRRGDTLDGIAGQFSVTVEDIRRWNGLHGNAAPKGARLRIYAGGGPPASHPKSRTAPAASSSGVTPGTTTPGTSARVEGVSQAEVPAGPEIHHHVKAGETLYSIARQYGTTVEALRDANPDLNGRELEAGDVLTVQRVR
jgi:membrane-bound lytic murein transglycosylase D